MVILGEWVVFMSEVPLYTRQPGAWSCTIHGVSSRGGQHHACVSIRPEAYLFIFVFSDKCVQCVKTRDAALVGALFSVQSYLARTNPPPCRTLLWDDA